MRSRAKGGDDRTRAIQPRCRPWNPSRGSGCKCEMRWAWNPTDLGIPQVGEAVDCLVDDAVERQRAGLAQGREQVVDGGEDVDVGGAEEERLVPAVAAAVQEGGGVGAGDDNPRHPHDVELEAGGIEPLDLLVHRHQDLARLVAALLAPRLLVLDVVAGHPHLDEAADQVADVGVAAAWPVSA